MLFFPNFLRFFSSALLLTRSLICCWISSSSKTHSVFFFSIGSSLVAVRNRLSYSSSLRGFIFGSGPFPGKFISLGSPNCPFNPCSMTLFSNSLSYSILPWALNFFSRALILVFALLFSLSASSNLSLRSAISLLNS